MKKIPYFLFAILLIFFLSLIPLRPFLNDCFFVTHDGENHLARLAAFYKALSDGQLPPQWAADLNYGYGHPILIFAYPLANYLGSIFLFLGFSLFSSLKAVFLLAHIFAGIFMYLFLKEISREKPALIGAISYLFSPYHFLNLYVRGAVGDFLALTLIPLVFYFVVKLYKSSSWKWTVGLAFSLAFFILSHNGVALIFIPLIFIYGIFLFLKKFNYYLLIGLLLGLLLSAFYWLPAAWERKYTLGNVLVGEMYKNNFPPVQKLIFSKWGFGTRVYESEGLSPQIGVILLFFATASGFILVFKKRKLNYFNRINNKGFLAFFLLAIFMMLPVSNFLWGAIPLLKQLQFPWRFLSITTFAGSVTGALLMDYWDIRFLTYPLIFFIILMSSSFWQIQGFFCRSGEYFFKQYTGTTICQGEVDPIWTAGGAKDYPSSPIQIIAGEGEIKRFSKKALVHSFTLEAKTQVQVLDNTVYFPGWRVKIDGKKVPIQFQDANWRGLITFTVPPGLHQVIVYFRESPIRLLADVISLLSIILVISISIKFYLLKLKRTM